MAINAFPINTVPPAANLIVNVPAGIVTATDVQAAINQLAAAIPSPGPGTDPLFLVHGLSVNTTNPALDTNANDRRAANIIATYDMSNAGTGFSDSNGLEIMINALHGQGNYNSLTQSKQTFLPLGLTMNGIGSGQKFCQSNTINSYGMSDASIYANQNVNFASGPISGDEGVGWGLVSLLQQQTFRSLTTITAVPTPSTLNTTTTQAITESTVAQTVTVVSAVGANIGDWVVVDQELPTDQPNMEPVQLTGVSLTSITGVFRCNHNNGCTIKPALLLNLASTFTLGQDRFLVNYTQPSYSTGVIASISGGGFTGGGGANWTVNMVGGNALNIGAIRLPSDDFTSAPFSVGNPCLSWYQINSLPNSTLLGILTSSVAGDHGYRGFGPGPTGRGAANQSYIIRPCAKILRIAGNLVICENSTSTWSIGDTVEQPITAYPDVSGFQYSMAGWTPGGTYRAFMNVKNSGARTFQQFIQLDNWSNIFEPGADGIAWGTVLSCIVPINVGIDFGQSQVQQSAILLPSAANGAGFSDAGGTIRWGAATIGPNTPEGGLTFVGGGTLTLSNNNTPMNPDPILKCMTLNGYIHLLSPNVTRASLLIEGSGDVVNYQRGRFQYDPALGPTGSGQGSIGIATEQNGTGGILDIVFKTNGVEQMRVISGDIIEISNNASFSANGTVATVLGSLGPAGSHTTVQKWLKFRDSSANILYIPCF